MKTKSIINDILFREIYGNKKYLKSFLNAFFFHLGEEINLSGMKLSKEMIFPKTKIKEKNMKGDILVELKNAFISIEAYTSLGKEGLAKACQYYSRIDGTQLKSGQIKYQKTKRVIGIIIATHISKNLKLENEWFQRYHMKGKSVELPHNMDVFILDIDKLNQVLYNVGENDLLMKHLKLIGASSNEERFLIAKKEGILMEIARFTRDFMRDKETLKYFNLENKLRTEGYDAGVDVGEEIGKSIGESIGKSIGKSIGRSEKALEIAEKMLKEYSINEISRITGLKNSEIIKLKKSKKVIN